MPQKTVGLKEFRENLSVYERQIKKGDSFVIMKRSTPMFVVGPVDQGGWETVIDFTEFDPEGVPADVLLKKLRSLK